VKIDQLRPLPSQKTQFAWSHHITVPEQPGCYVLVNYGGDVLYVGLATVSIRDRMGAHLDTREKRVPGVQGAAYWFYYILCKPGDAGPIERGWMNQAILEDGDKPVLNKIYSPL
jgi:excinuclease UvrABC nuclease subunit